MTQPSYTTLSNLYRRIRVLPYNRFSLSAKAIAGALGAKRIKLQGSKYKSRPDDLIVNWGNSKGFPIDHLDPRTKVLNHPDVVEKNSNKLSFFEMFKGKEWLPKFWTNTGDIAREAIEKGSENVFPVVCRTKLNSSGGRGIVIATCLDDLVPAKLYTQYIKKKDEYRVHVGSYNDGIGNAEHCIISIQQKKRRLDNENPNWQIRNHENGFIYARQDVNPPIGLVQSALDCFDGSGLDFGAVDLIWNEQKQKAYVLEINSAPGLEGTTLDDYVRYFNGRSSGVSEVLQNNT